MPIEILPKKIVNILLKDRFSAESEIFTSSHSLLLLKKCLYCKIIHPDLLCGLFAPIFIGQIKKWFKTFKTSSIHLWVHFQELFIKSHQEYDYGQLCEEIEPLYRDEDEFIDDFN